MALYAETGHVGVTLITCFAGADGFVILDVTSGVAAAAAGIAALPIDTRFVIVAVVVRCAAAWCDQLY